MIEPNKEKSNLSVNEICCFYNKKMYKCKRCTYSFCDSCNEKLKLYRQWIVWKYSDDNDSDIFYNNRIWKLNSNNLLGNINERLTINSQVNNIPVEESIDDNENNSIQICNHKFIDYMIFFVFFCF